MFCECNQHLDLEGCCSISLAVFSHNPHPPAAGPAPTGSSLWAALQSSQWLFFRHLTVQYRAQGRVTFDGRVDCFEVKAATFCSCDSFWPPSLPPSPLSLSSAVWCFALSLVWLCLHTSIQLQLIKLFTCFCNRTPCPIIGLQLTCTLCECSNSHDKRKMMIRVNNITWLRLSCGAVSVVSRSGLTYSNTVF